MTTTAEQTLVTREKAPLQSLAAQINKAHDDACASVRTALGHACRAGDLLLEAKRQLGHGAWLPWLRQNCSVSERTAQKYIQLARKLPELVAKTPRVADLSLREAIHVVTVTTGRIARLAPDACDQVLQRVEHGERPNAAIAAVTRQRRRERIGTPPPDLTPPPQTDQRRRKVNRREEQRMWQVVIGPNEAGMRLPELVEETRARPQFAARVAEADAAEREAVALEEQAKDLREDAKTLRAGARADVREAIINEHGPIYHFSETLTYKICDEALDERLKTLTVSALIDYLLAHRGEPSVQEVHRGYHGDMQFMDWVAMRPPLNGGWSGVGSSRRKTRGSRPRRWARRRASTARIGAEIGSTRPTRVFERAGDKRTTPPAGSTSLHRSSRISRFGQPE